MPQSRRRDAAPLLLFLLFISVSPPLPAQSSASGGIVSDSVPKLARAPIRWWHVAAAAGGVLAVSVADNSLRDLAQNHNTSTDRDIASAVQNFGQGLVPVGLAAGVIGVGVVARSPSITRAGGRLAGSLIVSALITQGLKDAVGRARPYQGPAETGLKPFSGWASMPSGHTTAAFAIATSLSDDIHRPWATIGLYALAAGTGVSRMVMDAHWFSDVVAGAIIGTSSAKLVSGRWRLFRIRPPSFLLAPDRAGLSWELPPLRLAR